MTFHNPGKPLKVLWLQAPVYLPFSVVPLAYFMSYAPSRFDFPLTKETVYFDSSQLDLMTMHPSLSNSCG